MRKLLIRLVIGLTILSGIMLLFPHNDAGNEAHAHALTQFQHVLSDGADRGLDTQDKEQVVDCHMAGHMFFGVSAVGGYHLTASGCPSFGSSDHRPSRTSAPPTPPPNA